MIRLIKNVRAYRDGEWKKSDILIAGDKIQEISDEISLVYDGLETVNARGLFAVPGYIDQHVHITGGGGEGSFITHVPELKLSDPVKAGVTTIVGVLGTDGTTRSVANLVSKAKAINEFGLTAYCLTGNYYYPSPTLTGRVTDDIVFIKECIGVKIAIADHRSSNMTVDELIRLASEARLGGLLSGKVGEVHIHTGSGKNRLDLIFEAIERSDVPVTIFRPTHLTAKFDDAMKLAKMGGFADFTCSANHPENFAPVLIRALEEAPAGSVTCSTDSNGSMPIWNEKKEMIGIGAGKISAMHDTIKYMVQKEGYPLEKAILPVTANVAKALQIYPAKGVLAAGCDADITLMDGDMNIMDVYAGGKCMLRGGQLQVKIPFEE